jgi:hypothetical protein
MASGINNTFRQTGTATGIAALGAVFQHEVAVRTLSGLRQSGQLGAVMHATHGNLNASFASGSTQTLGRALAPAARAALDHSFRVGFTGALDEVLLIGAAVALAGAAAGLALVRRSDFIAQPGADAAPAAA